jgi:hypothetical protein
MICRASAQSLWNITRHGENEQEALERITRKERVGDMGSNREINEHGASVSGSSSQNKMFYLLQIPVGGWHC